MSKQIKSTDGSIGYVEWGFAQDDDLSVEAAEPDRIACSRPCLIISRCKHSERERWCCPAGKRGGISAGLRVNP